MYARVTQFHIVPDKLDSFLAALQMRFLTRINSAGFVRLSFFAQRPRRLPPTCGSCLCGIRSRICRQASRTFIFTRHSRRS